ncbi:methyltransferase domain-containing protein [Aquicoccus sp.]|uniref:methyltransferase domain-containing protein n=1 Tax=Aquicoccus sp. TaxID=2055851 RepID=UPI0035698C5C
MSGDGERKDWDPGAYARFRDLRLRPAIDLMLAVRSVGGGEVVDLGCGAGAMGSVLRQRYSGHSIVGVDESPAMRPRRPRAAPMTRLKSATSTTGRSSVQD